MTDLSDAKTALHRALRYRYMQVSTGGMYTATARAQSAGWATTPNLGEVGNDYLYGYEAMILSSDPADQRKARNYLAGAIEIAFQLGRFQAQVTGAWPNNFFIDESYRNHYTINTRWFTENGSAAGATQNWRATYREASSVCLTFLARLYPYVKTYNLGIGEVCSYGLDRMMDSQYQPSGGCPDMYFPTGDASSYRDGTPGHTPVVKWAGGGATAAVIPSTWATTAPAYAMALAFDTYSQFQSLNDHNTGDYMRAYLQAYKASGNIRYKNAALQIGEFLLRAQYPSPQQGWAQSYWFDMTTLWMRKYEPPALSCRETNFTVRDLLILYKATGDARYKTAAVNGYNWALARKMTNPLTGTSQYPWFVEFGSNTPVFVDATTNPASYSMTTNIAHQNDIPAYSNGFIVEDFYLLQALIDNIDITPAVRTGPQLTSDMAAILTKVQAAEAGVNANWNALPWSGGQTNQAVWSKWIRTLAQYVAMGHGGTAYIDTASIVDGQTAVPQEDFFRYV